MAGRTRRTVLGAFLGGGTAVAAGSVLAKPPFPVGVQLWTVNAELDRDFDGTLRQLAAIGFRRVETAGLHGRSAANFAAGLKRAGLACDSVHVSMPDLQKDPAGRIADARALGARWLVCSSPAPSKPLEPGDWMTAMGHAMSLADWRRQAELLNRFGAEAAKAGLRLAYHNHSFDLGTYDGVTAYDEVMRLTDPKLVSFELDVGWAVAGGRDPLELLHRYGRRIRLLHLKDLRAAHSADTVPVGQGVIGWPAVLRAAKAAGVEEAFVEQEPPFTPPALQALAESWRYLQGLGTGR